MLNIKIKVTNFEKTPAIEDYVYKKVASLEKFLGDNVNNIIEVELGKTTSHHKSGEIFKAEFNITQGGSRQFYILAEESDLYAAIDVARDDAEEMIVSKNKKSGDLFRKGSQKLKNILKGFKKGDK